MKLNIAKILFEWSHRISSSELHAIKSESPCIMCNKQHHVKKKTKKKKHWSLITSFEYIATINLFTCAQYRIEVRSFTLAHSS